MNPNKVNRCVICGYFDDSRMTVLEHIYDEHSQAERHGAMVEHTQRPEVEATDD